MFKRLRPWIHRKASEIRKAVFFPLYHTGAEPPAVPSREISAFKTWIRKPFTKKARAIFFPLYHTGATPPASPPRIPEFIKLKARMRQTTIRAARAIFFPLFNTGAEPPEVVATVPELNVFRRGAFPFIQRRFSYLSTPWLHFIAPPAPVGGVSWMGITLASATRRGG